MQRIRIVLVEIAPPLLLDSTRQLLSGEPDIEVVEHLESRARLVDEVRRTRADLILLGLTNGEFPAECTELLHEFPRKKVLGMAAEGRRAFLYEMRPNVVPIGELDRHRLVRVVKEAARAAS